MFHQSAKVSISWSHTISIMFAAGGWPGSSPFAILVMLRLSKGVSKSWSVSIFLSRSTQLDLDQCQVWLFFLSRSTQLDLDQCQVCFLFFLSRSTQLVRLFFSSPRAKRAGPKGLRAESTRAFTGRRNSHSGRWEDFLTSQPDFFTETAVTPERKVEKSFQRWKINRLAKG